MEEIKVVLGIVKPLQDGNPNIVLLDEYIMKQLMLKDNDVVSISNQDGSISKFVVVKSSGEDGRRVYIDWLLRRELNVGINEKVSIERGDVPIDAKEVVLAYDVDGLELSIPQELANKMLRDRIVHKGEKIKVNFPVSKDIPSLFSDIIRSNTKMLDEEMPRIYDIDFFVAKVEPNGIGRATKDTKVTFKYDATAGAESDIDWYLLDSSGSLIARALTEGVYPFLFKDYVSTSPTSGDFRVIDVLKTLHANGVLSMKHVNDKRVYSVDESNWRKLSEETIKVILSLCESSYTDRAAVKFFENLPECGEEKDEESHNVIKEDPFSVAEKEFEEKTKELRKRLEKISKDKIFFELLRTYFTLWYDSMYNPVMKYDDLVMLFLRQICGVEISEFKNDAFKEVYDTLKECCKFFPKPGNIDDCIADFFTKGLTLKYKDFAIHQEKIDKEVSRAKK